MSMDSSGKIIFAKHSEISQANLKNLAGMWGGGGGRWGGGGERGRKRGSWRRRGRDAEGVLRRVNYL